MSIIKSGLTILIFLASVSTFAKPKAEIIETCSHNIMKLVRENKLPSQAASKLQMIVLVENSSGYQLAAVLEHDETRTQTPAHVKFKYDLNSQMMGFLYQDGPFSASPTHFTKVSAAKLFDLAAEYLLQSKDPALRAFSENVVMMTLRFDGPRNAAFFAMRDANKKELGVWMDLDGKILESKFK
jgi:hypothetical protein